MAQKNKTKKPAKKTLLTGKQKDILDFIVKFKGEYDLFPTNTKIQEAFDISGGNVSYYLSLLAKKGHLKIDPSQRPVIREIL